jgi:Predicted nucleic acid-binding protein, consists of a PIN domain and a Zn-ribbon module
MADETLDKFKSVFNRGVTSINVKTSTMIETAKIKTYIGTLQESIKETKAALGDKAYRLWEQGGLSPEDIQPECMLIRQKEIEIRESQQKIVDLEEQSRQILGVKTSSPASTVQTPQHPVFRCPHCGAEFSSPANFCKKCGGKMQG